jgi:hypothetical protein
MVDVLISFLFTSLFAWMVGGQEYQGPMPGAGQCLYLNFQRPPPFYFFFFPFPFPFPFPCSNWLLTLLRLAEAQCQELRPMLELPRSGRKRVGEREGG